MSADREASEAGTDGPFDHYARLVRRLLGVPTALVSIVEPQRQIFPGAVGLPEPYQNARTTPLSHSFCQYVVADDQPLIISDARHHPRVADNLAIRDLHVIAYAGWPLVAEDARTIGSLCAIDSVPREWTADELDLLRDLAAACSAELQQSRRLASDGEQLARTIFASADVAMAFYDTDKRLVMANDLAERAASLAGVELDRPPTAQGQIRRADNATLVSPEEHLVPRALRGELSDPEMAWVGPPGNQIALVASAQQVHHADGTPWGTLVVGRDVTELARALHVQQEFIATVSHELRTPLTSILGYLEILADELEDRDGTVPPAVATIERAALRLQDSIAHLLDTADRRRRLDLEPTDVTALVRGVASTFQEQARAANIDLTVSTEDAHWAVLDPRRITQVLENLLLNAVTYTEPGGHVTLDVHDRDDWVEIAVTDTGIGMSTDDVAQALDPFWRASRTHQQAVQGLGLGLTLVRDLVDAHHGSLEIASRPGEGTTVTVTLRRRNAVRLHS